MEFLEPIANLLGLTSTQLMVIAGVSLGLVIFWYVLKTALKIAAKAFTVGCFTIIALGAGLWAFFAFFQ